MDVEKPLELLQSSEAFDVIANVRGGGLSGQSGALRLGIAVWLVGFTRQATVMFGATLVEVAHPDYLMSMFHIFYLFAIVLSVASGVLGLLAGLALLAAQRAGRTLAIIASFLSLSELPIGITLAVYTLLALFPRGERLR